jgi:secreted trypsin-like serine protease
MKAAHCGSDRISGKPVVVLLGVVDTDAKNGKIIEVNDFIIHPKYKSHEKYNDIALVRLTSAINFSDRIRPACLATRSLPVTKLIAIGFGKTEFG